MNPAQSRANIFFGIYWVASVIFLLAAIVFSPLSQTDTLNNPILFTAIGNAGICLLSESAWRMSIQRATATKKDKGT